jgi:hypothetical protein
MMIAKEFARLGAGDLAALGLKPPEINVRTTPSLPEIGPISALYRCVPTRLHGPACILWSSLTPLSTKRLRKALAGPLSTGGPRCVVAPRENATGGSRGVHPKPPEPLLTVRMQ